MESGIPRSFGCVAHAPEKHSAQWPQCTFDYFTHIYEQANDILTVDPFTYAARQRVVWRAAVHGHRPPLEGRDVRHQFRPTGRVELPPVRLPRPDP